MIATEVFENYTEEKVKQTSNLIKIKFYFNFNLAVNKLTAISLINESKSKYV